MVKRGSISHLYQRPLSAVLFSDGSDVKLLAISGSLRRNSASTSLLQRIGVVVPSGTVVAHFDSIPSIPAFNPDEESGPAPAAVAQLQSALAEADGVLFSTPEYAHGVPGALKNALDWLVGSGHLYRKPVAVVQPSTRGEFARASLIETLKIMGAEFAGEFIVDPASETMMVQELLQSIVRVIARTEAQ
jgi:NAD(P)H-dependent FMN reductase